MMKGVKHELHTAGNTKLFEYPKKILLDCVLAEPKLAGHIAIAQAIGDQRHHLFFTRGQQLLSACAHNPNRRYLTNGVEKTIELFRGGEDFSAMDTFNALAE